MKKIMILPAIVGAAVISVSCARSSLAEWEATHGRVEVSSVASDAATRAVPSNVETLKANAIYKIYTLDPANRGLIRTVEGTSNLPSSFHLATGDYRVDVEAFDTKGVTASFTDKSYAGSQSFTVTANQTVAVEVPCTLRSAAVELVVDESVTKEFDSYSFNAGYDLATEGCYLNYNASTAALGYFTMPDGSAILAWNFTGTRTDQSSVSKSDYIYDVQAGYKYTVKLKYTSSTGTFAITVLVDTDTDDKDDTIVFAPDQTGVQECSKWDVWACHANLSATVNEEEYGTSTIQIGYRTSGSSTWSTVAVVKEDTNSFAASVGGLSPQTAYEYALLVDGAVVGSTRTLTTDIATALVNGSFESWSGSSYPLPYGSSDSPWWGSGNEAANMASKVICTYDSSTKVDGTYSAKLQAAQISILTINKLAPGNLFTGEFAGTVGTTGGKVNFGRPFTARPTSLTLSFKYNSGSINNMNGYPSTETDPPVSGGNDRFQIYIMVGDWDYKSYGGTSSCPVQVNTTVQSSFIDLNGANVIGYAELVRKQTVSDWTTVTLPLTYLRENATPTHIIISCSSSQFGDYFTGSSDSVLWVDNMILNYE